MDLKSEVILTGIKPTGKPHIGNYIGAIKVAIEKVDTDYNNLYFIADYHAMTTIQDPVVLNELTYEVAATWLAFGLDTDKVIFYRQSDIKEIFELNWILACLTSKGLMNRAHAYKSMTASNLNNGVEDIDKGVNMGIYTYPILMASDILLFGSKYVPVGKDQIQHVEIARDIASKFNLTYQDYFELPEYIVEENSMTILGLDGRKMSKSYNNTIPLLVSTKDLKRAIFKIKTDSLGPSDPKPLDSALFQIYQGFASEEEVERLKNQMINGISWGEIKNIVFEKLDSYLKIPREKYNYYMSNRNEIDALLEEGSIKARKIARARLNEIKKAIGIKSNNED